MSDEEQSCENCVFLKSWTDMEQGECRRRAPVSLQAGDWERWPTVEMDDWCGEWSAIHPGVPESREGSPDER